MKKNLNSALKDVLNVYWLLERGFLPDRDGNAKLLPPVFPDFGVDGSFWAVRFMATKVSPDGAIVAWKADNSSILYSFSVRPS